MGPRKTATTSPVVPGVVATKYWPCDHVYQPTTAPTISPSSSMPTAVRARTRRRERLLGSPSSSSRSERAGPHDLPGCPADADDVSCVGPQRLQRQERRLCQLQLSSSNDIANHTGDVVGTAGTKGEVDELVSGVLRVVIGQQAGGDGVCGDDAGKAVAAEQDAVAFLDLSDRQVRLSGMGAVEHPGEHVALRVCCRVMLGQTSGIDERLHERVVARDALEGSGTHEVAARVANVNQAEPSLCAHDGGEGGAHSAEAWFGVDQAPELVLDPTDCVGEHLEQIAGRLVVVQGGQRGYRNRAGDLACGGSAHAVGDDQEV